MSGLGALNRKKIRRFDAGGSTGDQVSVLNQTASGSTTTPADAIAQMYQTTLGRAADTGGLNFWTNAANNGTSLADIQNSITSSPEAQAYAATQPGYHPTPGGLPATDASVVASQNAAINAAGGLSATANPYVDQTIHSTNSDQAWNYNDIVNQVNARYTNDQKTPELAVKSALQLGIPESVILTLPGVTPEALAAGKNLISSGAFIQTATGTAADAAQAAPYGSAMYNARIAAGLDAYGSPPEQVAAMKAAGTYVDPYPNLPVNAVTSTATTTTAQAVDPNEAAIKQLYLDTLGRAADPGGLQFWEQAANSGKTLEQIKAEMLVSNEAKSLASPTPGSFSDAQVAAYIKDNNLSGTALTNAMNAFAISPDQLTKAQALLASNDPLVTQSSTLYKNAVAANPNAVQQNTLVYNPVTGTGEAVDIGKLYQSILGRAPDAGGLASWVAAAQNGATLDQIKTGIANSDEGHTASQIAKTYQDYTGALPTAKQLADAEALLNSGKTVDDIAKTLGADTANSANIKKAIDSTYQNTMGRPADNAGSEYWTHQILLGNATLGQVKSEIANSTEAQAYQNDPIVQDYQQYLGRTPTVAESATWRTQLANGTSPADIAKSIALSDEGIKKSTTDLTALLTAQMGADFVKGLSADQIKQYATTFADPNASTNIKSALSFSQFDPVYYAQNNPDVVTGYGLWNRAGEITNLADLAKQEATTLYSHYMQHGYTEGRAGSAPSTTVSTADQKLQAVYAQIAQDPTLGPKLKASDPKLYAAVTSIENITGAYNGGVTGTHGTISVNGVDVPILSAQSADGILGNTQSHSNFSATDIGWAGGGASANISKGADALNVTKNIDENGLVSYSGDMNAAAKILGVDATQFKDTTTLAVDANGKPVYQTDGDGNTITDINGKPIQATKTVSAQDQLYKAINDASQNLYSFTGANLDQSLYNQGTHGSQSFETTLYQKIGDKLIPITVPQAHGGVVAYSDFGSGGDGWSDILPAVEMIGMVALAATGVGAAAAAEIGAAVIGEAGTVAGGIIGGAAVGAATGAALAALNGGDVSHGAVMGAIGGGVGGTMNSVVTNIVPDSVINGVSGMTNLTPVQVTNAISSAFSSALVTTAAGANSTQIIKSLGISLVASGLSQSAANEIKAQFENMDPKQLEQVARATQLATSTLTTSVLSGKNTQQITQSLINTMLQGSGSISNAGNNVQLSTNGRDQGSTGLTTGAVDQALIDPVIKQNAIDIANASNDAIGTMNAVKNWTGEAKNNLTQATGVMLNQGMDAATISQNLQDFYKIPADEATKYAEYMVAQSKQLVGPVQPSTTPVTTPAVVTRDITRDREANRDPATWGTTTTPSQPTVAPVPTNAPLISGMSYTNTPFASQINWNAQPTQAVATTPTAGNAGFMGSVGSAAAAIPSMASAGEMLSSYGSSLLPEVTSALRILGPAALALMPSEIGSEEALLRQMYSPTATTAGGKPISEGYGDLPGKPTTEGYGGIPFNPANHVEPPAPFRGEAAPAPEGFADVPNLPGATPAGDVVTTPANDPHVWDPTAVPNAPTFTPAGDSITASPTAPKPDKVPVPIVPPIPGELPTTQPATQPVTRPGTATEPAVTPQTNTETAITPQVQTAIQTVARTQAEAQSLTQAVPLVENLISQNIARTIAISTVATQVNVPVLDLTKVIDVAVPQVVPDVTVPTPTPTPTPKTPASKTPKSSAPQTVAGMRAAQAIQNETGLFDLGPAFTKAKTNYQLAGQFGMATGGAVATSQYDPFGLSNNTGINSGVTGGDAIFNPKSPFVGSSLQMPKLTVGTTKPQQNYQLAGYPSLGKTNIGYAEGGEVEHNPQFFSEGGLGTLENRYVKGDGDGTSDSVPAMLANGEFVIPADVVAKLGNGSNEAGAGVLDQFLAVIREHAQKHNPKELPPDSKGPLAYLLDAKKRA